MRMKWGSRATRVSSRGFIKRMACHHRCRGAAHDPDSYPIPIAPTIVRTDALGRCPPIPIAAHFRMIKLVTSTKPSARRKSSQGFSLDVMEGETMVIIGYSGTGKSVAIKHIVGLLVPDSGTVFVDDKEVPKLPRREFYALRAKIGYVFQFAALFDSLTIGDNVAMGLRKLDMQPNEIRERVSEALRLVDLPDTETRYPGRALRRHAQARRNRPRHRPAPEVHPLRRAHHGARPGHERRH